MKVLRNKTTQAGPKTLSQTITRVIVLIALISSVLADLIANFSDSVIHSVMMNVVPKGAGPGSTAMENALLYPVIIAANLIFLVIFLLVARWLAHRIGGKIAAPIDRMASAAEKIADGELDVEIGSTHVYETSRLAEAFRRMIGSLSDLRQDVGMLVGEAKEGRLDTRADDTRHRGGYREIVGGVNEMLDAVKAPLDEAAADMGRLAAGEAVEADTSRYKGYYAQLIKSIGEVSDAVGVLVEEAGKLAEAGRSGRLDVRGDEGRLKGRYAEIVRGVNETFDEIQAPLDAASAFIGRLAEGTADQPLENVYHGYYAKLVDNLNAVLNSLMILLQESGSIAEAGARGDLSARGDTGKVPGHYADVIDGVNRMMDAVSAPLGEAGRILENITGSNDFTETMAGDYQGAFRDLSDSINQVIARLNDVEKLYVRVAEGDLSMLETYKKIGKRSENDRLIPSAVSMMQSISDLVDEAHRLALATVEGDLSQRGDESKFQGGYRKVIEGINQTVEAVVLPQEEASRVLGELARSNLTVEMTGDYRGEFNKVKHSIKQMVDSFNEVLSELRTSADQVAAGSRQVSDASQSLSQGATEQASSIEELTSSIAMIAAQTKQNAANATQASELTMTVKSGAVRGNDKMTEMLGSMNGINEASANISKIIKVIDDIAFQTNILALNAAVEAARAGQYGKGFAVVAEEVRNLAGKSAEAAKETTAMIENSISRVEAGTVIANETAKMLRGIVESSEKSSELVSKIAAASSEQATAIAQIDQGVNQVSGVVQTNSATAEESAASSEELSGQADMLTELVGRFKLRESAGTKSAAAIPARVPARRPQPPVRAARTAAPAKGADTVKISLGSDFGKY
jgi:methyl-accepting chemotaxis protein